MTAKGYTKYEPYKELLEDMALTKNPTDMGKVFGDILGIPSIGATRIRVICNSLNVKIIHGGDIKRPRAKNERLESYRTDHDECRRLEVFI